MEESAYHAACNAAALFDLDAHGKVEVAGPDARSFLHNLCTNDIKTLPDRTAREAFLTTAKARVVAHFHVNSLGEERFLLDLSPGQADKLLATLDHYLISEQVELTDRGQDLAMLRLLGPRSGELLENMVPEKVAL